MGYVLACNLQVGLEMRDISPFFVLSPRIFNEKTSLVIGLPTTTAAYNADNPFAVESGKPEGRKAGQTSYALVTNPSPLIGDYAGPSHTQSGRCPMACLHRYVSA